MIIRAGKFLGILLVAILMNNCATYNFFKLRGDKNTCFALFAMTYVRMLSPHKRKFF